MNRPPISSCAVVGCVLVFGVTTLFGQFAGAPAFDLSWNTVDAGGGTSIGGSYSLSATIGQADGGAMAAGQFVLTGGFWAGSIAPPAACEGDTNASGIVNVDDLLGVITSWGACAPPCPPHCSSDIAPWPAGNCIVNVDDLLSVITHWGSCP